MDAQHIAASKKTGGPFGQLRQYQANRETRPMTQRPQKGAPLRRIADRTTLTLSVVEVLECSHVNIHWLGRQSYDNATYRRCFECPNKRKVDP